MLIVGVHVGACREGNELRNQAVSFETVAVRNLLEDYVVNEVQMPGGYIMLVSPWSNST
jgi:hypothetical protein